MNLLFFIVFPLWTYYSVQLNCINKYPRWSETFVISVRIYFLFCEGREIVFLGINRPLSWDNIVLENWQKYIYVKLMDWERNVLNLNANGLTRSANQPPTVIGTFWCLIMDNNDCKFERKIAIIPTNPKSLLQNCIKTVSQHDAFIRNLSKLRAWHCHDNLGYAFVWQKKKQMNSSCIPVSLIGWSSWQIFGKMLQWVRIHNIFGELLLTGTCDFSKGRILWNLCYGMNAPQSIISTNTSIRGESYGHFLLHQWQLDIYRIELLVCWDMFGKRIVFLAMKS